MASNHYIDVMVTVFIVIKTGGEGAESAAGHYTNNALHRGSHEELTNPRGYCPPRGVSRGWTIFPRVGQFFMAAEVRGIICFIIPTVFRKINTVLGYILVPIASMHGTMQHAMGQCILSHG